MLRCFLVLCSAALAFGADDPWSKVKALKSGTEIRIYKRGTTAPLTGKVDEVRDDSIAVVLKNEQVSIDKDSIDRLDARPSQSPRRMTSDTKSKAEPPDPRPPVGMNHGAPVPGTSSSTSVSFGSKADFENVYRRAPQQKK
jgi:hypothetical protein